MHQKKRKKKTFEIAVVLAVQMKIASIGLSCLLVRTSKTAPMLCFFSLQEKLVSQSRRQLAGISSACATCVLGSADYYQRQHLALLACFKQSSIFLFPETGNTMCFPVEFGIKYF